MKWISQHDIVILNEIKRASVKHAPGFIAFVASNKNPKRGGTAILLKHSIYQHLKSIDTSVSDQIWFEMKNCPNTVFGGVYIPPEGSDYFEPCNLAEIQARTMDPSIRFLVIGDMNARCGTKVQELATPELLNYFPADLISNNNGNDIIEICKDNDLKIINGMSTPKKTFSSSKTFRRNARSNTWISELDICVASKDLVNDVRHFEVCSDTTLPSDHAPLWIYSNRTRSTLCPKSACKHINNSANKIYTEETGLNLL